MNNVLLFFSLHFSNIGFEETTGVYTVQQNGVYIIDSNFIIENSGTANTKITTSILFNSQAVISANHGVGETRTVHISELQYLVKGATIRVRVSSDQPNGLHDKSTKGGFSVYFVKPLLDSFGKLDIYD